MARKIKPEEYTQRRNEILAVTRRLVFSKGYEQMAIQDILDNLHISKGAFYHYFPTKQALLEALIDSIIIEIEPILLSIVRDGCIPALEKFSLFFRSASQWKTERKDFLMGLLHAWYSDENAIVRQKVQAISIQRFAPMLAGIIKQGIHEGSLHCAYPDMAGEVSLHLLMGMGDTISDILLSEEAAGVEKTRLQHTLEVYTDAMERVLGAPAGSIQIIDPKTLEQWVVSPANGLGSRKEGTP